MTQDARRGDVASIGEASLRFSVIVPIYNRAGPLRQLLEALGRQDFPADRFEVLVCDDGSTDDLSGAVEEAAGRGLRARLLRQQKRGPGPARNLGLAQARGEVAAFTDSDCLPGPGWLSALDRAFESPGVDICGGSVAFREAEHLSGRCINFLNATSLGGAGGSDPGSRFHMRYYPRGMNVAVRRDVALAAHGFPPHSHGEDLEFVHRVLGSTGGAVRYVADASVVHNERRSLAQAFNESVRRGEARVRLCRELGLHEAVHAIPTALALYIAAWLVLLLSWPAAAGYAVGPIGVYAVALGVLAVQGGVALGDARALIAIPAFAGALHLGHGVGYLLAWLGIHRERGVPRTPAWVLVPDGEPAQFLG